MLTQRDRPDNDICRTAKAIRDITNRDPVPIGETVEITDFDPCGDEHGVWLVWWRGMLYMATPDELRI